MAEAADLGAAAPAAGSYDHIMETVSAAQFASDYQLPDWRYILGGIEATFVFDSFGAGARFVVECADAADAADHHPDVSLRYPGVVHIALITHFTGGLTNLDTDLAAEFSRLAEARGPQRARD